MSEGAVLPSFSGPLQSVLHDGSNRMSGTLPRETPQGPPWAFTGPPGPPQRPQKPETNKCTKSPKQNATACVARLLWVIWDVLEPAQGDSAV